VGKPKKIFAGFLVGDTGNHPDIIHVSRVIDGKK
jgi:hypothetical protein